jgi:integrase/recombinase XerD
MRIKEVASLRICDVVNTDGTIKAEVRPAAEQAKGRHSRTVFLPELTLFCSHTCKAFSANTLCNHIYWLYRRASISGASSHSGRRTFITSLSGKGIGVRVLASLAGTYRSQSRSAISMSTTT